MANDRLHREQDAFLERHNKSADLLVFDTGFCIEALYYSPMKKAKNDMEASAKSFFQLVRETELAGERYNDMPNNLGADLE